MHDDFFFLWLGRTKSIDDIDYIYIGAPGKNETMYLLMNGWVPWVHTLWSSGSRSLGLIIYILMCMCTSQVIKSVSHLEKYFFFFTFFFYFDFCL